MPLKNIYPLLCTQWITYNSLISKCERESVTLGFRKFIYIMMWSVTTH